ncbi:MAG: immune inhibitor A [Anaerolineales bacterium]|nr:immune inhibitor A [Anaerolineales bacterium]
MVFGAGRFAIYELGIRTPPLPYLTPFFFDTPVPTPTVVVTRLPLETIPTDTLTLLEHTDVPENNLPDLACRLEGKCNVPLTMNPPAAARQVGEQDAFWVSNSDTNAHFQVTATLRYVTAHVYFWVEDGVKFHPADLQALAEAFEMKIYPTNRAFFGSEWTPGVDGDPHIYILYAKGLGSRLAGYFSSADEYHPLAHEYSNAHEMFLLNADTTSLSEEFTYGVLAHEFQHMIHWHQDRNETSWLNEGFSELAAFLNDYNEGGFDWAYIYQPDLQLNDWPNDEQSTTPHYGAGFLFTTYFLDRFGEEATQALAKDAENGLESVDNVLRQINAADPHSGQPITADDFFMDWTIANYLQDGRAADGRYAYHNYTNAPQASDTESVENCPSQPAERSVHQYGVDYIRITCPGDYTLHFAGSTVTRLLPVDPSSGAYAFWSNKGDESNMTLTRPFDFTAISGPITFTYRTWYDLEEDYDYLYLEASRDGQHWQILVTSSGTAEDPSGNSFGWGYNGVSGGWIQESVDLSQFAGQKVSLRFEYVTDAAVNGEGFLLDDLVIPEIGYQTDFEADDGGWQAAGFVRIQNILPQTFRLALILKGNNGTRVTIIPINPDQTASIPFRLGGGEEAILVVSGTTRFTRELAAYQFSIR